MRKPLEVKAIPPNRLWLRFADGVEGEVSLAHLIGRGVFGALSDRALFEQVQVNESGAIEWVVKLDLCSDALYKQLTGEWKPERAETEQPAEASADA